MKDNTPSDPADPTDSGPTPHRRGRRRFNPVRAATAPVLTTVLLIAMTAYGLTLPTPGDADAFHAVVFEQRKTAPLNINAWRGRDEKVAEEAIVLLRPNAILSRTYINESTGEGASLLIVQTKDARDLLGHWPPVCYPSSGWTISSSEKVNWTINGSEIPGRRYRMAEQRNNRTIEQVVDNFLVLPDGRFVREMDDVIAAASSFDLRFFGASQVQMLTTASMTDERRDAIFTELVGAYDPFIQSLRGHGSTADLNPEAMD